MGDAMHFEAHAAIYDEARPPYPPQLWDALRERGLLYPGARALDLGAGSGQATGPLLAAGLSVTAVEPGPWLADRLRAAFPQARVIVARAEDAPLPDAAFDIAVAATAIHWMDLDAVLPRIRRSLAADGAFAVWRNIFGDPAAQTPFRERVGRIVAARREPPRPSDPEDMTALAEQLTSGGWFQLELTRTFRWSIELTEDQVRRLFTTFSDWSPDEADQAAAAARHLGGSVVEHYLTALIVLRPVRPPAARPPPGAPKRRRRTP